MSVSIGNGNKISNSVIQSDGNSVVQIGNQVIINGVKLPPCPSKYNGSTIIDGKVYIGGYEFIQGRWKRTLAALWHMWF